MDSQGPHSSDPKTDPTVPLICHRVALRLVSWVKSSYSAGAAEAPDSARVGEGTTIRVTKAEAVRKRSVRTATAWRNCSGRTKFPGKQAELRLLRACARYKQVRSEEARSPRIHSSLAHLKSQCPHPTGLVNSADHARASKLFRWGVAAACTAFLWTLASVVSRVSSATFPVMVRGSGLQSYTTSFTIISPVTDQLLLLVCSASILIILEFRIRRLGYVQRIVLILPALMLAVYPLFPAILLPLGAAGTIIGIVYLVLNGSELLGVTPGKLLASVLVLLAASAAAVSFLSMVRWVLNPIDGAAPLSGWSWSPSVLAMKLLNQPYSLLPRLTLFLFISWPLGLLFAAYGENLRDLFAKVSLRFTSADSPGVERLASNRSSLLLVVAGLAGALFVGLYPYLPGINPNSVLVGADVKATYFAAAQQMVSQGPLAVVGSRLQNERTGFLLFQYALTRLTGSVDFAVRVIPSLLTVLLAVSTYLFVKSGSKDRLLTATASLFAAFSFQVVTGINGGLDANWLATSESLVFLCLLLAGLNRLDGRYVALSVVASALILFTHPWTWLVTMGVVAAYGLLTWAQALTTLERGGLRFELVSVGSVVFVNLAMDGAKSLLGSSSAVQDVYTSSASSLSLANLPNVLGALQSTLAVYLGGAFDNPVIVVFAIIGLLTMADLLSRMNRLLFSWVAVASVGILLSPYNQSFYQARIIALVPLQVLAAMGFLSVLRYLAGLMSVRGYENQGLVRAFVVLAYVAVFGAMAGYALQNIGSLFT